MVDDAAESSGLESELSSLLNKHSAENPSGTPDFILASYLTGCLDVFNKTVTHRGHWRGESVELPALQSLTEVKPNVVPLVTYEGGQRNEIGTAEVQVTPGEVLVSGKIITSATAIFGDALKGVSLDEPKDEPIGERSPLSRFDRYMRGEGHNGGDQEG